MIDQTVTVNFPGRGPQAWARELLTALGDTLALHGGASAILRNQAPPLLNRWSGVDAVVVSADNALT